MTEWNSVEQLLSNLYLFFLCFARVWGLGNMTKFMGGQNLPLMVRHALFMSFTFPIFAAHLPIDLDHPKWPDNFLSLTIGLFNEVVLGTLLGFSSMVPFWAVDFGCYIIDTLRGTAMGAALNPSIGSESSGLGLLFTQLLSILFLTSGGFKALLKALYRSYIDFPLLSTHSILDIYRVFPFIQEQVKLMFILGMSFAMPAIIIMLLVDIALGLLSLGATQLKVFFLAMPIKGLLCILLLAVSLPFSVSLYLRFMLENEGALIPLLKGIGG